MTKKSNRKPSNQKQSGGGSKSSARSDAANRSRTRERRQERLRQRRRQQRLLIGGAVAVVAIVIVLVIIVANQPTDAPIDEDILARYDLTPDDDSDDLVIPRSTTAEGFPLLGNPNAPVQVTEFSSFACPGCAQFHDDAMDDIVDMVIEGEISFVFVPLVTGSLRNPDGAIDAAICAGEQGMFWEYHDVLFDWHRRFGNQAFISDRLRDGAENLGLDVDAFNDCRDSDLPGDIRDLAIDQSGTFGVTGTPATFVGVQEVASNADALRDAVADELERSGLLPVPLLGDGDDAAPEATPETTPEVTDEAVEPTEDPEPDPEAEATEEAGSGDE